jgi:signal transduction histidine kinase
MSARVNTSASARLRRWQGVYLFSALLYPWWWFLTPPDAADPWILWILVSVIPLTASAVVRLLGRAEAVGGVLPAVHSILALAHLFGLAAFDGMRPYYAIASLAAGLVIASRIRTQAVFVVVGASLSLAIAVYAILRPDPWMLVYWGPLLPFFRVIHQRLTLQLAADRETRDQQAMLERSVVARTVELDREHGALLRAQERLRHEQGEREQIQERLRVAETLGRLASGMAHDFNNLLAAIQGYSEFACNPWTWSIPRARTSWRSSASPRAPPISSSESTPSADEASRATRASTCVRRFDSWRRACAKQQGTPSRCSSAVCPGRCRSQPSSCT